MNAYEMTVSGNDITGVWEPCNAKTLAGAMREATRLYGSGYTHHTIKVAIAETDTQERQIVATREIAAKRWERF